MIWNDHFINKQELDDKRGSQAIGCYYKNFQRLTLHFKHLSQYIYNSNDSNIYYLLNPYYVPGK